MHKRSFVHLKHQLSTLHATMTEKDKKLSRIDFTYGNLACSTNHKPSRAVFRKLALEEGFTEDEFDAWAKDKEWWAW